MPADRRTRAAGCQGHPAPHTGGTDALGEEFQPFDGADNPPQRPGETVRRPAPSSSPACRQSPGRTGINGTPDQDVACP